jgi:6-phosphogluconate dehydrogenase
LSNRETPLFEVSFFPMKQDPPLPSWFSSALENTRKNYRRINILKQACLYCGTANSFFARLNIWEIGASPAYFDSYRQERLPANLLQAQREKGP